MSIYTQDNLDAANRLLKSLGPIGGKHVVLYDNLCQFAERCKTHIHKKGMVEYAKWRAAKREHGCIGKACEQCDL